MTRYSGGLAALYLSFHRAGQRLGVVERRMERIVTKSAQILESGPRYLKILAIVALAVSHAFP
jgi:hypothetical protein